MKSLRSLLTARVHALAALLFLVLLGPAQNALATHGDGGCGRTLEYEGCVNPDETETGNIDWDASPADGYDDWSIAVESGVPVSITATRTSGDLLPNLVVYRGVACGGTVEDLGDDPDACDAAVASTSNSGNATVTVNFTPTFSGPATVIVSTWLGESGDYELSGTGLFPCDEFRKEITDGPDRNNDGQIDRVIEKRAHSPSTFTFKIFFEQPDLPSGGVCIEDCVPWQWEVLSCVPDDENDLVLTSPTGDDHHGHFHYRDTLIQWYPTDNSGCLECTIRTRRHDDKGRHWEPHKCMCLMLNKGARAVDSSTGDPFLDENGDPLVTNELFVAAMKDKNKDNFIDYSGNGDEDEDGLTDYEECEIGTDPCDDDTDGDKIPDGQDPDPLEKDRDRDRNRYDDNG